MSKRKFSDLTEAGPSRQEDEVIVISDSEDEEPACVDIHEVPQAEIPAAGLEEEPTEEDEDEDEEEDPEEDSEWLAEAVAHDAAILEMEELSTGEEVPIDEVPEPEHDPAWDTPVPEPKNAPGGDAPGEPEPVDDVSITMVISAIQQAAAEVHHTQALAEDYIGAYMNENAQLRELLEAERRRTARLTTLVDAARNLADSTQSRMDRLHRHCVDSLADLANRVRDFPCYPDQPYYTISRQVVQHMIRDTEAYLSRRF